MNQPLPRTPHPAHPAPPALPANAAPPPDALPLAKLTPALTAPVAISRAKDYWELLKPRLTTLVLLTVTGGYVMGSGPTVQFGMLWHVLIGMAMVVGGGASLNQYLERVTDRLMKRTENRPLPAARLRPVEVLLYGSGLAIIGLSYLAIFTDLEVTLLAASAAGIYLVAYTPLKTRTVLNTMVGGITGALPPVIGWAAAGGAIAPGAWALFWILFVWQLPHFFALSWCYKDDYRNAGIKMMSGLQDGGRAVMTQILVFGFLMIPVSLMPTTAGAAGLLYFWVALVASLAFFGLCARVAWTRARQDAWLVFWSSIAYLPLLFSVMLYDRIPV